MRYIARNVKEEEYGWSDVCFCTLASIFSWIWIIIITIIGIFFIIGNTIMSDKPPKWL